MITLRSMLGMLICPAILMFGQTIAWTPVEEPIHLDGGFVRIADIASGATCPQVIAVQTEGVLSPSAFLARFQFNPSERPLPVRSMHSITDVPAGEWLSADAIRLPSMPCGDGALLLFARVPAGTFVHIEGNREVFFSAPLLDDLLLINGKIVSRSVPTEGAAITAVTAPALVQVPPRSLIPRGPGHFYLTRQGWGEDLKRARTRIHRPFEVRGGGRIVPARARFDAEGNLMELTTLGPERAQTDMEEILRGAFAGHRQHFGQRAVEYSLTVPFYVDPGGRAIPYSWLPKDAGPFPQCCLVAPMPRLP